MEQLIYQPAPIYLPTFTGIPPRHTHVLPSLSLGGAERIVCDLAEQWARQRIPVDVIVMREVEHAYDVSQFRGSSVCFHRLGKLPWPERMRQAAEIILANRSPAFAHLTSERELRDLWAAGCQTIPVVHNAATGWAYDPDLWNTAAVPWVAACGDVVADHLKAAGYHGSVKVLRHIVPERPRLSAERRAAIRAAFGPSKLLIGMVGRIVPQKYYTRAVTILAELVRRGIDARLAIIGSSADKDGQTARDALLHAAHRLGVRDRLSLPGPIKDSALLVEAFDVFLNTSSFEGVSIATMEAVAANVPVVTADVGGQREAIAENDTLLSHEQSDWAWGQAILAASQRPKTDEPRANGWLAPVAAARWAWLAAFSTVQTNERILFVTANLDVGGAQRSLCNLSAELAKSGVAVTVAVCGPIGVPDFMTAARAHGAEFVSLVGHRVGLHERVNRVLGLALDRRPTTLCFWNMDPPAKYAIAKVLADGPVRLADASPGPMLYQELANYQAIAQQLSMTPDSYIRSLDLLGAKYSLGLPPGPAHAKCEVVIPNGVPLQSVGDDGPRPPAGFDPNRAVICVTRLAQSKHPEMFPLIARRLAERLPGASLTIVGGLHTPRDLDGLDDLPDNLFFVGLHPQPQAFLPRFAGFLMISEHQGCPNASLEAMASGLPVIANADGGTGEQVIDGLTGRLIVSEPWTTLPERMVDGLTDVLADPARAAKMGAAGYQRAVTVFSMEQMARAWQNALLPTVRQLNPEKELCLV